jgi:hypothetical protein
LKIQEELAENDRNMKAMEHAAFMKARNKAECFNDLKADWKVRQQKREVCNTEQILSILSALTTKCLGQSSVLFLSI